MSREKKEVPTKKIRCAIYTRTATVRSIAIEAQRRSAETHIATQDGWLALAERYDDCGHAGTNTDRPALQRLLAKVKNGEVSYVVVDSVDRLSRSARDLAQIIRTLNKHDAAIVFVNGGER